MTRPQPRLAVFPGSFDPVTLGHLDVIRRGAALFDPLVVAVGHNPDKTPLLSQEARCEILRQALANLPNVRVEAYQGLTMDLARRLGACALLRGLRGVSDLASEIQVAMAHRAAAGLETVFILSDAEHAFISSSVVRQIVQMGGDVSALVPPQALPYLKAAGKRPLAASR